MTVVDGTDPSHWVFTCLLDESLDRDTVILELKSHGIDAGLVHTPNHNYTCFAESMCDLPETNRFANHQISLPCGWWLTSDDVHFIANKFLEVVGN